MSLYALETIPTLGVSTSILEKDCKRLTLDISDALVEDLLEDLGVFELLLNLGDDGVRELTLLPLLDLAFVAHPGVEDRLGLLNKSSLLLQLIGLGLQLGGFLREVSFSTQMIRVESESCYEPWTPRKGPW
jgi:hypothetical protein